jgi:hypothetical protein
MAFLSGKALDIMLESTSLMNLIFSIGEELIIAAKLTMRQNLPSTLVFMEMMDTIGEMAAIIMGTEDGMVVDMVVDIMGAVITAVEDITAADIMVGMGADITDN